MGSEFNRRMIYFGLRELVVQRGEESAESTGGQPREPSRGRNGVWRAAANRTADR